MDRVRTLTRDIGAREDARVTAHLAALADSRTRVQIAFVAVVVFAFLLILGAGLGVARDVHRVREVAAAQEASERRFRLIAERSAGLVRIHAPDGNRPPPPASR